MSNQQDMNPPNAPYGSPERMQYWSKYWQQWGGSDATHLQLGAMIQDFEQDIIVHQAMLKKYEMYKGLEIPGNWDDAIRTSNDTINHLKAAIAEAEAEFKTALAGVGKQ